MRVRINHMHTASSAGGACCESRRADHFAAAQLVIQEEQRLRRFQLLCYIYWRVLGLFWAVLGVGGEGLRKQTRDCDAHMEVGLVGLGDGDCEPERAAQRLGQSRTRS